MSSQIFNLSKEEDVTAALRILFECDSENENGCRKVMRRWLLPRLLKLRLTFQMKSVENYVIMHIKPEMKKYYGQNYTSFECFEFEQSILCKIFIIYFLL